MALPGGITSPWRLLDGGSSIVAASVEAASGTARCPRAALFFGITLLGVRDKASFTTANKLAFKQTLLRLAPKATFLPVAIGPEDTGQVVHTIALFPGSVQEGVAAAQALAQKLRSGAFIPTFDQRRFGRVHLEVCSAPFLADSTGDVITGLAGSQPAGMITVAFYDKTVPEVTPALRDAYVAAVRKLVPGSTVTYATHEDDGDWGGEAGAGGRYAQKKIAMDTVITGGSADALAKALKTIRDQPGKVWPVWQFGQMHSEDGFGVRWVPNPDFVSPCDVRTTLKLSAIVTGATFDPSTKAAYLAALRAKLPPGVNTTIESVTRINGGWKVVTSSVYPVDEHVPTLTFARQLKPPCSPLGANPVGPGRLVFITEGDVITGPRLDKVFASHVVLTDARNTSSTSGQATAAAFPADGFIKYIFHVKPVNCPTCPTKDYPSPDLVESFPGLQADTLYNVTISGVVQNNVQTPGCNSLTFRTPPLVLTVRLTRAVAATTACKNAAAVSAAGFSGPATSDASAPSALTKYKFTARPLACPTCPTVTVESRTGNATLSGLAFSAKYNVTVEGTTKLGKVVPGSNWLQVATVPAVNVTSARARTPTSASAVATPRPRQHVCQVPLVPAQSDGLRLPLQLLRDGRYSQLLIVRHWPQEQHHLQRVRCGVGPRRQAVAQLPDCDLPDHGRLFRRAPAPGTGLAAPGAVPAAPFPPAVASVPASASPLTAAPIPADSPPSAGLWAEGALTAPAAAAARAITSPATSFPSTTLSLATST
ncbi:hypothetical protein ABPG77_004434 [Micractinium sp. CCAP 211/92]